MAPTQDDAPADPLAALFDDWLTIWQSECAALWVDREVHETMQRAVDGWAEQARRALAATQAYHDAVRHAARHAGKHTAGGTGSVPPPRPAPAADAPDGRDELVRQLLARVDELERRLPPTTAQS